MSENREPEAAVPVPAEMPAAVDAALPAVEPADAPIAAADAPASPVGSTETAPSAATEEAPAAAPEALLSGAADVPAVAPAAEPPAAAVPVEAPAAQAYDWQPFTLPDGLAAPLDEARLTNLRDILTTADLSPQDRAQQLLDLHVAEMRAYDEATLQRQMQVFEQTQVGWRDQFKGDPELGGAGARTSLQRANAAIRRFASEDRRFGEPLGQPKNGEARESDHSAFMDAMRVTGMINHPEMVRFLSRVENMLREPAGAAPAIGPSAVPRDIGNRRPSQQGGNPGRGAGRVRDMYDHPRSGEVFNGGGR